MRYSFLNPNKDTFEIVVYKRIGNSYEFEQSPCYCRASVVGQSQIKLFRLQQGVKANDHSIYLELSNCPFDIPLGSKVLFNGEEHTVQSVGYFLEQNGIVNNGLFSDEYIKLRCPKGIALS